MATPETFVCDLCGGTFEKAWSDAEATAELAARFPGLTKADCAEVCDECDVLLMEHEAERDRADARTD